MKNQTTVERKSDREVVVTRTINGSARAVFEAWSNPDLFKRWWVPKSFGLTLVRCEADVRTGGKYRLAFSTDPNAPPMEFFGTYTEVTPFSRIVWTNEESPDGAVTTVTFAERDGKTLVVLTDLYPTKEALDAGIGSTGGMSETFDQLEEIVGTLNAA